MTQALESIINLFELHAKRLEELERKMVHLIAIVNSERYMEELIEESEQNCYKPREERKCYINKL